MNSFMGYVILIWTSALGLFIFNYSPGNIYAQSLGNESYTSNMSPEQAKSLLSDILSAKKQGIENDTNLSSSLGGLDQPGEEFRSDLTGHYSNPKYGIIDFVIPEGWYASEIQNGEKRIIVDIQPGTENEILDRLTQTSEVVPTITIMSDDKEELKQTNDLLDPLLTGSQSGNTDCTSLQPNSTATVDGKTFKVSTMECKTITPSFEIGSPSGQEDFTIPGENSTEVIKKYEYESPTTLYALQLRLPTEGLGIDPVQKPDVNKYIPVLDSAFQTLRIK